MSEKNLYSLVQFGKVFGLNCRKQVQEGRRKPYGFPHDFPFQRFPLLLNSQSRILWRRHWLKLWCRQMWSLEVNVNYFCCCSCPLVRIRHSGNGCFQNVHGCFQNVPPHFLNGFRHYGTSHYLLLLPLHCFRRFFEIVDSECVVRQDFSSIFSRFAPFMMKQFSKGVGWTSLLRCLSLEILVGSFSRRLTFRFFALSSIPPRKK